MLTPIEKGPLSEEVAQRIRSGIFSGAIKPGQKLLEQALSEQMNISRGPIRDAFIRLEHEGLVLREPNRSVTVVEMGEEDVEEIHSLRLALELLALRSLCERDPKDAVGRMRAAVRGLRDCLDTDEYLKDAIEYDLLFHEEMVRGSGHGRLLTTWQGLKSQIGFLMFLHDARNDVKVISSDAADHHDLLLDAVVERDYRKCERALQTHLEKGHRDILKGFRATSALAQGASA